MCLTHFWVLVGPYHLNGCPLRRINQIYVIATKTRLDISGVKLPERVSDEYFKRQKLNKPKHTEGEIFDTEKAVSNDTLVVASNVLYLGGISGLI